MSKAMTIRLDPKLSEALDWVAATDSCSVVDVVRRAVADHIEKRRADPEFQAALRERIKRMNAMIQSANGCDECGRPSTHVTTPGGFRFCDSHGPLLGRVPVPSVSKEKK